MKNYVNASYTVKLFKFLRNTFNLNNLSLDDHLNLKQLSDTMHYSAVNTVTLTLRDCVCAGVGDVHAVPGRGYQVSSCDGASRPTKQVFFQAAALVHMRPFGQCLQTLCFH